MITTDVGFGSLSDFVHKISVSGVSRRVLLLRTDRLPKSLSRPEQARSARLALEPLINAERALQHELPAGRIAASWKGDPAQLLSQTMGRLARLLEANPLGAPPLQQLVSFYELPHDGSALLEAAIAELPVEDAEPTAPRSDAQRATEKVLTPLSPAELDRLEQSLAGTDISRFARRRPVSHCSGSVAKLAWEERTLSIPELIDTVAPGRDARADIWLFRRLTRVLDRRLLAILSNSQELAGAKPFSITLNVASVLSPEFLRFDAALPSALRNQVVVSFLPADIASDAAAFAFARNFARGRSFRVCLRAVSAGLLPALNLPALDLDYVQLIWSAELAAMSKLPDPGKAQWIVGQPCTAEAVTWGLKHDIDLFTMKPTL